MACSILTGAGEDDGIVYDQNWLRFPYDCTFLRSHDLHDVAPATITQGAVTTSTDSFYVIIEGEVQVRRQHHRTAAFAILLRRRG
jgi:hypothetical protein